MIYVRIETENVESMQNELNALLSGINKGTIKDVVQAVPEAVIAPVAADSTEAAEPEQPVVEAQPEQHTGDVEAVEAVEAPVEETVVEETKYPSMTDTRAVLNKLRAKKGPKAVKEILTAHGVSSFVDLDSADYAAVMAEAEEALNG